MEGLEQVVKEGFPVVERMVSRVVRVMGVVNWETDQVVDVEGERSQVVVVMGLLAGWVM